MASNKLILLLVAVPVLGWSAVGSTLAWSSSRVSSPVHVATVNPDQGMTGTAALSAGDSTPAVEVKPAVKVAAVTPVSHRTMTKADFDQAFVDAASMPRRDNTPGRREGLRNAGWKRIIGAR
jgi:hypothetical protein